MQGLVIKRGESKKRALTHALISATPGVQGNQGRGFGGAEPTEKRNAWGGEKLASEGQGVTSES